MGTLLIGIFVYAAFGWKYWYITVPIGIFFAFMVYRKKTSKRARIAYSICAIFFLWPIILLPAMIAIYFIVMGVGISLSS
ncbi:hypothetical protein [Xenorhabdus sp. KK7.4]|uniref:hypothetical protein n=1 Tax=Xenorhabdus sp. KK7.4 TaxID=1851572 RepID=UPI000C045DE5|nr:hypothetical protein [Xenorhabdus sp. KK7.4]PHM52520.1 hypothetical protein Xekk_03197 [Xenorhabdus sp. KK7.4]